MLLRISMQVKASRCPVGKMLSQDHDNALVEQVLAAFGDLSGPEVQRILGPYVSQSDVSRWRSGKAKALLPKKRRFLRDFLSEFKRCGVEPGRDGVSLTARRIGVSAETERLKGLKRWLTHPDILPREMSHEERMRIGESVLKVDAYSAQERENFYRWRDDLREAVDAKSGSAVVKAR